MKRTSATEAYLLGLVEEATHPRMIGFWEGLVCHPQHQCSLHISAPVCLLVTTICLSVALRQVFAEITASMLKQLIRSAKLREGGR